MSLIEMPASLAASESDSMITRPGSRSRPDAVPQAKNNATPRSRVKSIWFVLPPRCWISHRMSKESFLSVKERAFSTISCFDRLDAEVSFPLFQPVGAEEPGAHLLEAGGLSRGIRIRGIASRPTFRWPARFRRCSSSPACSPRPEGRIGRSFLKIGRLRRRQLHVSTSRSWQDPHEPAYGDAIYRVQRGGFRGEHAIASALEEAATVIMHAKRDFFACFRGGTAAPLAAPPALSMHAIRKTCARSIFPNLQTREISGSKAA